MAITSATGGIITNYTSSGTNYRSHTFLTSGQLQVTGSGTVALLVVGGGAGGSLGGGGESNTTDRGNGGGAGGFVSRSISLTAGIWTVTIGQGGSGGTINSPATSGGITSFTSASVSYTGSYGGFGGQPTGGEGSSGGGSFPTGAASIFGVAQASSSFAASLSSFPTASFYSGSFFQLTGSSTQNKFTSIVGKFILTGSVEVDSNSTYYILYPPTASAAATASLVANTIVSKLNNLSSSFNIIANSNGTTVYLTSSIVGIAGNSNQYASASISQSFEGGRNDEGYNGGTQQGKSGAGGGGAATTGSDAYTVYDNPFTIYNGGNGGLGVASDLINGTGSFYAAGGGGGGWVNCNGGGGTGGSGVGGNGGGFGSTNGTNGVSGSGGGGGALSDQSSNWGSGGDGGSGIVVVRYTV
jgi:hypothetical protein